MEQLRTGVEIGGRYAVKAEFEGDAVMVEEVMERLYRIEVPLPNSPLKELNSYVIKGDGRDLVIDTGFNRTVCYEAMREGLDALDCDPARTDFLITHMHSDHAGLVARLASGSSTVYFSRIDSRVFDKDRSWQPLVDYAEVNGFPADELMKALQNHPGFKYKPETVPELTLIDDGYRDRDRRLPPSGAGNAGAYPGPYLSVRRRRSGY